VKNETAPFPIIKISEPFTQRKTRLLKRTSSSSIAYPRSLLQYSDNMVAMNLAHATAASLLFMSVPSSAATQQVRFSR
jgi:hypothetical protein